MNGNNDDRRKTSATLAKRSRDASPSFREAEVEPKRPRRHDVSPSLSPSDELIVISSSIEDDAASPLSPSESDYDARPYCQYHEICRNCSECHNCGSPPSDGEDNDDDDDDDTRPAAYTPSQSDDLLTRMQEFIQDTRSAVDNLSNKRKIAYLFSRIESLIQIGEATDSTGHPHYVRALSAIHELVQRLTPDEEDQDQHNYPPPPPPPSFPRTMNTSRPHAVPQANRSVSVQFGSGSTFIRYPGAPNQHQQQQLNRVLGALMPGVIENQVAQRSLESAQRTSDPSPGWKGKAVSGIFSRSDLSGDDKRQYESHLESDAKEYASLCGIYSADSKALEENSCQICFAGPKSVVSKECGHAVGCVKCIRQYVCEYRYTACPICKMETSFIKVRK